MEKAENVEYVLRELERLKVEIQRLESMLMPVLRGDDITDEEIAELLELAKNENPKIGLTLMNSLNPKTEGYQCHIRLKRIKTNCVLF